MKRIYTAASDQAKVSIPAIPLAATSAICALMAWFVPSIALPVMLGFGVVWVLVIVRRTRSSSDASARKFSNPANGTRTSAWSDFLLIVALELPFIAYMTIEALRVHSPAYWIYACCPFVTLVGYRGIRFWRR